MRLFMIADDFTGALDTGVQFAERGAAVRVVTDSDGDLFSASEDTQVLILDAETRHMDAQNAYDAVYRAVRRALESGFTHIYKKTDSALRGNIGSELEAVLDAAETKSLLFIPALPQLGRTTRGGVQYIDGVPVAESVFGRDPFEPVRHSSVADIIAEQSPIPVTVLEPVMKSEVPGIHVYDAGDTEDMERIGRTLEPDGLTVCAGCAGFALTLVHLLGIHDAAPALPILPPTFCVICGSVNPVTLRQMEQAENSGFLRIHLTPSQKLEPGWPDSPEGAAAVQSWMDEVHRSGRVILDANDPADSNRTSRYAGERGLTTEDLRVRISGNLGRIGRQLLDQGLDAALLCTGGDTLLALMREAGVNALTPLREVSPGVVLASFSYGGKDRCILTKSGGFGAPGLFCELASMVEAGKPEHL